MADQRLHSRGPTDNSLNTEGISKLIDQARQDPAFFHDLVWNTERSIASLDYLTRREKANILAVDPDSVVVGLVTGGRGLSPVEVCGVSCAGSCGGTCGASCLGSCGASCGGSCEGSCGGTCGGSCGSSCGSSCADSCVGSCTASGDLSRWGDVVIYPGDLVLAPGEAGLAGEPLRQMINLRVRQTLNRTNFSQFRR